MRAADDHQAAPDVRGSVHLDDKRAMLRHFLAALAYRTQKAVRDAPDSFGEFRAGQQVRTPADLVRHMTSVLGYARTHFVGGMYRAAPLPDLAAETARFHSMLEDLARHLKVDQVRNQPKQIHPNRARRNSPS